MAILAAEAQQTAKLYRIGYVGPGSGSTLPAALDAFRQQLHHLGYVEGQHLAIEYALRMLLPLLRGNLSSLLCLLEQFDPHVQVTNFLLTQEDARSRACYAF